MELWRKTKRSDLIKVSLVQMWAITAPEMLSYIVVIGGTKTQKQQQERNCCSQHFVLLSPEAEDHNWKAAPRTDAAPAAVLPLYAGSQGGSVCGD